MMAQRRAFRGDLRVIVVVGVVAAAAAVRRFVKRRECVGLGWSGRLLGRCRAGLGELLGAIERRGNRRLIGGALVTLEQRVILQKALELLIELQCRELQQPDRLLQLRGQGEMLG